MENNQSNRSFVPLFSFPKFDAVQEPQQTLFLLTEMQIIGFKQSKHELRYEEKLKKPKFEAAAEYICEIKDEGSSEKHK